MEGTFFGDAEDLIEAQSERDKQQRDASSWKPAKGDRLTGVLLKAEYRVTQHGPTIVMMVRVVDDNTADQSGSIEKGKTVLVWLGTVRLQQSMRAQQPRPGKGLIIQFNGKIKPESGGNAFNDYTVVSEESAPEVWEPLFAQLDEATQGPVQRGITDRIRDRSTQPGADTQGGWF